MEIYFQHLQGKITAEQLEGAGPRLLEGERFPLPGDILRAIVKPEESKENLEAEKAWLQLEKRRAEWGPDLMPLHHGGKDYYPPALDGATEYGLSSIGGWDRFCNYDADLYGLMRRDFILAYKRHRETKGLLAPSREEARKILAQVEDWKKLA